MDVLKTAKDFVSKAAELVGGDRARQHGDKGANFRATAVMWQAYLDIRKPGPLRPEDFAHMMVLAKITRTQTGAYNPDDYVDMAGYSGCAGEVATQAHEAEKPVDWLYPHKFSARDKTSGMCECGRHFTNNIHNVSQET